MNCHREGTHSTNAETQRVFKEKIAQVRNMDLLNELKWQTQKPSIQDIEKVIELIEEM